MLFGCRFRGDALDRGRSNNCEAFTVYAIPKGSMHSHMIYFGLEVRSLWALCGFSTSYMGTCTLEGVLLIDNLGCRLEAASWRSRVLASLSCDPMTKDSASRGGTHNGL